MTGMPRLLVIALVVTWSSIATADNPVTITGSEIALSAPIAFSGGKPVLKPESLPILDQLAAALVADPDIALVEIQGHTDARGSDQWNLKVSERRARAVHAYLVSKGVDAKRLRAKGYGETKPLDKRAGAKAGAKDSRIAFVILKRS